MPCSVTPSASITLPLWLLVSYSSRGRLFILSHNWITTIPPPPCPHVFGQTLLVFLSKSILSFLKTVLVWCPFSLCYSLLWLCVSGDLLKAPPNTQINSMKTTYCSHFNWLRSLFYFSLKLDFQSSIWMYRGSSRTHDMEQMCKRILFRKSC